MNPFRNGFQNGSGAVMIETSERFTSGVGKLGVLGKGGSLLSYHVVTNESLLVTSLLTSRFRHSGMIPTFPSVDD